MQSFNDRLAQMGIHGHAEIDLDEDGIAHLTGRLGSWREVVDVGHMAAKLPGVRHVVCDLQSPEVKEKKKEDISPYRALGEVDRADVVIIGGGVTGCGIARQLSRYQLDILLIEAKEDIACGTTKANNGMIHSGYDSKPDTLKAKLNVRGNALYSDWARDLGFQFNRTGSFVCGFDEEDRKVIEAYYENGKKNGVPGIEIISGERAREIEPALSSAITCALWTPSAGYVEPYEVALALAENAVDNGVRFRLSCRAVDMEIDNGRISGVLTNQGLIKCDFVINAAGLYADEIAEMAGDRFYSIHPRRGGLVIFDKEYKGKLSTFAGLAPSNYTKGGGPMMTPDGTMLWGPSAKEVWDKEDLSVEQEDMDFILGKAFRLVEGMDRSGVITYFAGNRAATYEEDFIIENSKKLHNFMHVAGIQSPGLASSPAIAELVDTLFLQRMPNVKNKANFHPVRQAQTPFARASVEEREAMLKEDPRYGHIICRCESVTEGEIVKAIHGKIPATTIDSVKRRTRAGMGRCQGGFCGAKVLEILSRELGVSPLEVTLKGEGSQVLLEKTRQVIDR